MTMVMMEIYYPRHRTEEAPTPPLTLQHDPHEGTKEYRHGTIRCRAWGAVGGSGGDEDVRGGVAPGGPSEGSAGRPDRYDRELLACGSAAIIPREILEESLKPMGISQNVMGRAIGVAPRAINEIVHGRRAITPVRSNSVRRLLPAVGSILARHSGGVRLSQAGRRQATACRCCPARFDRAQGILTRARRGGDQGRDAALLPVDVARVKQESFFACHIHAFERFGGVPEKETPDNLKAAIIVA